MSARIDWEGLDALYARMGLYQEQCKVAMQIIADYFAPVIEAYAKENASWVDRTGNARAGLTGFVQDLSETVVAIYLAHRMDYGLYLELAHQARYAIIMPTLEAHYAPVMDMVRRVFG